MWKNARSTTKYCGRTTYTPYILWSSMLMGSLGRRYFWKNLLYNRHPPRYDLNRFPCSGFQPRHPIGGRCVKRKIRRGIEIALPLLGMGIIFGSVLFGPSSLQLQVLLVLIGVLILEAGVWGLTSGILPNERRYLALREEGDHFMGLIRLLNAAAVASDAGEEDDARFQETRAKMHTSVERMAELAGQDDLANAEAAEAFVAEAESLAEEADAEAEAEPEAEEAEAEDTEAEDTEAEDTEPAAHELN